MVAEKLSFTRAAEALGTTQPLLGRAMRRLEDVIGESLFDRRHRQIQLTPAGIALAEDAAAILNQVGLAVRNAQQASKGPAGLLRLGLDRGVQFQTFRRGLREFVRKHPEVDIEAKIMYADDQADALRSGDLDLGFLCVWNDGGRDLSWTAVGRSQLIVAIPSDWPVDVSKPISLASLRDYPFLLPDPRGAPEVHALQIRACIAAGFQPAKVRYVADAGEVRFMVSAGLGVAFVFDTALHTQMEGVNFLPIANAPPELNRDFHLAWHTRRRSGLIEAFIEAMTKHAPTGVPPMSKT